MVTVALAAAAAGGAVGAKLWPTVDVIDLRTGRSPEELDEDTDDYR